MLSGAEYGIVEEKETMLGRGNPGMRYLGYILKSNTYYNFYPCAEIRDHAIIELDNYERRDRFPTKGNINVYTSDRRDNILSQLFRDGLFCVIDLPEVLEDNVTPSSGELNMTNKKISIHTLIGQNALNMPEKLKLYPVIEIDSLDAIKQSRGSIHFDPDRYGFARDELVMLRCRDRLYGPFFANLNTQAVSVSLKDKLYLVDTYTVPGERIRTISNITSFPNYNGSLTYVSLEGLEPFKTDCIPDEVLAGEMKAILSRTDEGGRSPEAMVGSAFDGLNIPGEILEERRRRLSKLFRSQETLDSLAADFSAMISRVMVRAANEGSEAFDEIIQKLAADPNFMNKIQRYSYIRQQIDEAEHEMSLMHQELASLQYDIEQGSQQYEKEMAATIGAGMEDRRAALRKEIEELTEKLHLASDVEALRSQKEEETRLLASVREEKEAVEQEIRSACESLRRQAREPMNALTSHIVNQHIAGIIEESVAASLAKEDPEEQAIQRKCAFYAGLKKAEPDLTVQELCRRVARYRPGYAYNDIVNLFLCVANGFLTVFSGAPGTGKTSICTILAHALGLDALDQAEEAQTLWKADPAQANRFALIPVERGWTSKRDLIGYYNPLTRTYDRVNPSMFQALEITGRESGEGVLPYFVLLDEANLSPMEYYWADFMAAADHLSARAPIAISEGKVFHVSPALRFLATINNDHTTESLSPRLIDRAWIVTLPLPQDPGVTELTGRFDPVPMKVLEERFCPAGDMQMNPSARGLLKEIYDYCRRQLAVPVSPRTELAIRRYCAAGGKLFESVENVIVSAYIAVDYAVAQKVIPQVQGSGAVFREKLEGFCSLLQANNLVKSAELVGRMMAAGDNNMMYYQFFA